MKCEKDHRTHKSIYYGDIIPDDDKLNKINEF